MARGDKYGPVWGRNGGAKRNRLSVRHRKLGRERAYGIAYSNGVIEVDPRQDPQEYLDTLIHELLHQAAPTSYLDEEAVVEVAQVLTKHLWESGYRRELTTGIPSVVSER